jgi:hypothetical protein
MAGRNETQSSPTCSASSPTNTTSEGVRTMSTRNGRVTRLRARSDVGEQLMGAADAIADMA